MDLDERASAIARFALGLADSADPWIASSIGEVTYISSSSDEAPSQPALTVSRGNSTTVLVASGSRVNETPPARMIMIAVAEITAGRFAAQRIMMPALLPLLHHRVGGGQQEQGDQQGTH